ncbi:transcription factor E2F8-like [Pollicipes pollicipes]|uniref:transcription factor E2F8-like n=1 Tax=Pollicipes pollicipes TaxID=41117 RepID=UPI001884C13A|nr:transcription factor E2F8-like [Pollicipes pollicipes]
MLLLVSDRPWLSQDVLARVLLGQDGLSPDGQHKAKVRRLYDIANILQSVGLVGKETSGACRRPLFAYTGAHVDPIPVEPDMQRSRHSLIPTTPLLRRPAGLAAPRSAGASE